MLIFFTMLFILLGNYIGGNKQLDDSTKVGFFAVGGILSALILLFSLM